MKPNKEDKQYTMVKVLKWLGKSDIYISPEQMALYAGLSITDVVDCFQYLEQKNFIKYVKTGFGGRSIYEQNKHMVRCQLDELAIKNL